MRVFDPSISHVSSMAIPPPKQIGGKFEEDERITLAEELAERESIPLDTAYSIVCRHFVAHVKEARSERYS